MRVTGGVRLAVGAAVVAALVVLGVSYLSAPRATDVKVGDHAPDLELRSGGGAASRVSDYRGRAVLLTMFHSAAPFSQAQVPGLERLHRALLQRGLLVLGVCVDADPADRESFIRRNGVTFIVLEDPGGHAVRAAYGADRFPQTYLLDGAGIVRAVWPGAVDWTSPEVRGQIEPWLPRPKASP